MDDALLAKAIERFQRHLDGVGDRWSAPTPCADWDVRTLANHVVGELLWVPPLLEGATIAEVGDRFDGDVLGADPQTTGREAAAGFLAAAATPGARERTVHLSFGDFPGGEYLGQVGSDVVIHTWDLARALGDDDRLDPDTLAFVDGFLTPQIDAWRAGGAFGPAVPTSAPVGSQERLLAETGRDPGWERPGS
jgi:uncharacterized protein (TIGR03086 family)